MRTKPTKRVLLSIVLATAAGASAYLQPFSDSGGPQPTEGREPMRAEPPLPRIVGSGRVEAVHGQVDVAAQIAGSLAEVRVEEGQRVEEGTILAVLKGARQTAGLTRAKERVQLAQAQLQQTIAGNGEEEIAEALAEAQAVEAQLQYEQSRLERIRRLAASNAATQDELDLQVRRVERHRHQLESLRKQHEALRRGPLTEEIAVARAELQLAQAELEQARVEHEYRFVRAPLTGTVLELYRHAGDSVSTDEFTPIARMANTRDLRVRVEIAEANVRHVQEGLEGDITLRGIPDGVGTLKVETIVPSFGAKRLFNPDTTAQHDGRALNVLCTIVDSRLPLYPGQRVTASFRRDEGPLLR